MGIDLQTEHERYLTGGSIQEAIFVIDYPKEIRHILYETPTMTARPSCGLRISRAELRNYHEASERREADIRK